MTEPAEEDVEETEVTAKKKISVANDSNDELKAKVERRQRRISELKNSRMSGITEAYEELHKKNDKNQFGEE